MANSKTIRAADGGYLLDAEQFKYTKDELGRPVLTVHGAALGGGDFMADGSVPMTGDLQMDGHAIYGVDSLSNTANGELAIESDLSMNNHKIGDLKNPTASQDAATKVYVDSKVTAVLPAITASDNGKVLGVVDGQLAWVSKA